jgi:hypothetical protein
MLFTAVGTTLGALLLSTAIAHPQTDRPHHEVFGYIGVTNKCSKPVYVWYVGSEISTKHTVGFNETYSEPLARDPITGGIAIKVTTVDDGLFVPGVPQTILSYSLNVSTTEGQSTFFYDLSDVFGDAFAGSRVEARLGDSRCETLVWPDGVPPAGSQVRVCSANSGAILSLCA